MATSAFYFAWCGEDDAFDASMMRYDDHVLEARFSHSEGDFATLDCVIKNPRVGLLTPGRQRWIWFAYNPNHEAAGPANFADVIPLFHGRIIGIPPDLVGETVTLSFLARPTDYEGQKEALAETLRVRPYWDPVWFAPDDAPNPDNVLEARNALWHIDPVTLEVTISNITTGEDGGVSADGFIVPYDSVSVSIGDAPTREINVSLTVNWDQIATGGIQVISASNVIETYTADGLVANWPKSGTSMQGGWRVEYAAAVKTADPDKWVWDYDGTNNVDSGYVLDDWRSGGKGVYVPETAKFWIAGANVFPAHVLCLRRAVVVGDLVLAFDTARKKTEELYFTVSADTQAVTTDDTDPRIEEMALSTAEVVSPIDEDGAMPLGWLGARSYLNTDRGARSIEFALMCARARLIASARCVEFGFEVPFDFGISRYTTRKNALLEDYRLPGGVAAGKVTRIEWNMSESECTYMVTAAATVGYGGSVSPMPGDPTYADDGYADEGWQRYDNQFDMPDSGDIAYESLLGAPVNDDGITFNQNGQPFTGAVAQAVTITNRANQQEDFIKPAATPEEVYKGLNENAQTKISVQMKPVNSGPFITQWTLATTKLVVAQTIDLEAPAA